MDLSEYFVEDDGSLPEIQVGFSDPSLVPIAFKHLYDRGARNVTVNGGHLWIKASDSEQPFSGHEDALLVATGAAEPFHVVLAGIMGTSTPIPDLGVFVYSEGLDFDYRMGLAWGQGEIESLLALLVQLRGIGGQVSVPWWGANGERHLLAALGGS